MYCAAYQDLREESSQVKRAACIMHNLILVWKKHNLLRQQYWIVLIPSVMCCDIYNVICIFYTAPAHIWQQTELCDTEAQICDRADL